MYVVFRWKFVKNVWVKIYMKSFRLKLSLVKSIAGANPTNVSFHGSVVKIYNAANSLDKFDKSTKSSYWTPAIAFFYKFTNL
jgi:hypothetical protein